MSSRPRQPGVRGGSTLVPFAILTVALLGLAALAIDLGQANLTRRQMQAGVDAAALEGLRWRDTLPDADRRLLASQAVARLFDEDLDLATEDDRFGAGPQVDVQGVGTLDALGQITIGDPGAGSGRPLYRRRALVDGTRPGWLELNLPNAFHGDLVAGDYDPDASHADGQFLGGGWLAYERTDFAAAAPADSSAAPALLARLRRGVDTSGLDEAPGVASAGPPLPWLFARGSTLRGRAGGSIADGITVRATSIAAMDVARTVGPQVIDAPVPTPDGGTLAGLAGFAPMALDIAAMGPQPPGHVLAIRVRGDGVVELVGPVPVVVGRAIRSTHLIAPMGAADTVLPAAPVSNGLGDLPARVRVGAEVMRILAEAPGGGFLVDRGVENTAATAHPAGRRVTLAEPVSVGMALEALQTEFVLAQSGLSLINLETDLPQRPGEPADDLRAEFILPLTGRVPALPEVDLVVGFVRVLAVRDAGGVGRFRLVKLEPTTQPLNVSSALTADWLDTIERVTGPLPPAQRGAVAGQVAAFASDARLEAPVPAAALVRSY